MKTKTNTDKAKKKHILGKAVLIAEVVMTTSICLAIILNSLSGVMEEMSGYATEVETDYNSMINGYVTTFEMLKATVTEKISEDVSFEEMDNWLRNMQSTYEKAIGNDVFDGFAFTYKGGYVHSWDYGDYSEYDPSQRPWYIQAEEADGKVAVIAPYVTYLDETYLDNDEYIIMTISQKYNDDIYFDYDIKTKGISRLLDGRNALYEGTQAIIADDNGYILSSSRDGLYCHNINKVDDEVTDDICRVLTSNRSTDGKIVPVNVDGTPYYMSAAHSESGITVYVLVPAWSAFLQYAPLTLVLSVLLIVLEFMLYFRNKINVRSLKSRDARLSAITSAAYKWQVAVNADTMTATNPKTGDEFSYADFFKNVFLTVGDTKRADEIYNYLSPEAIKKIEPDDTMQSKQISVERRNDDGTVDTRLQQINVIASMIDQKKIVTILCNDVTESEKERQQVLWSVAAKFESVVVCNLETQTYSIINADTPFAIALNQSEDYDTSIDSITEKYIDDEFKQLYRESLLSGYVEKRLINEKQYDITLKLKNGHWVNVSVIRCVGFEKNRLFVQCTQFCDQQMTQQEKLKAALEQAKSATRAKTDFLSRMSHDMRTPMNGILGLSALMKDKTDLDDIQRDVDQIRISGRYLLDLINDTLDMSRIESGRLELHPVPTNSSDLFKNIISNVQLLTSAKKQEFNLKMPPIGETEWLPVVVDSSRLEQILMNLISNAVKYTPEGGRIDLEMETVSVTDDEIVDKYVIRDNGIGMDSEFIPHIFEAFSQEGRINTERQNGTGLGMSIVKQLVDMMGGEISVKSKINEGTEFTLIMRYDRYNGILETSEDRLSAEKLAGRRVLLCEDHPLNALISVKLLEKVGIITDVAENGKIGYEKYTGAPVGTYDAILMDVRMPVMNGINATKAIRASGKEDAAEIPIIAMTANAFDGDVTECINAGMVDHVAKPVEPEKLYSALERHIRD